MAPKTPSIVVPAPKKKGWNITSRDPTTRFQTNGLRRIAYPTDPSAMTKSLPSSAAIGVDAHWIFGSDNPNDLDLIGGLALGRNLRVGMLDCGQGCTVAGTIAMPNGAVGVPVLSSSAPIVTLGAQGGGYISPQLEFVTDGPAPIVKKRLSAVMGQGASAGKIIAFAEQEPGIGYRAGDNFSVVITDVPGSPGAGATFTARMVYSLRRANITNPGSSYPAGTTLTLVGALLPGTSLAPVLYPVIVGGQIVDVLIFDAGFGLDPAGSYTITATGSGGSGFAATGVVGANLIRAVALTSAGQQTADIIPTVSGGNGSGFSLKGIVGAAPTRSAGYLSTAAGTPGNVHALNGLLTPFQDTGEFTLIVVTRLKLTGSGAQIVTGTIRNSSNAFGGYTIQNNPVGSYKFRQVQTLLTSTSMTLPGTAADGAWAVFSVTLGPVPGLSVQPSAAVLQGYKVSAKVGSAVALEATGSYTPLPAARLIGIGNTGDTGTAFLASGDFAELMVARRALSPAALASIVNEIAARQALRGNTVVA